jgi:hypothetical protein
VVKEIEMGEAQNGVSEAELIEQQVDRELAAEEARRRAVLREEIASKQRREAYSRHLDWVNRRRPEDDPPSPEEIAQRDAALEASRAAMREKLDANERRWREQEAAREAAERRGPRRPRMQVPGHEGFERKW